MPRKKRPRPIKLGKTEEFPSQGQDGEENEKSASCVATDKNIEPWKTQE